MRWSPFLRIDYEELSREANESSRETMELRCRKRRKIEIPAEKSLRLSDCGALALADNNVPSNFCNGGNVFGSDRAEAGCTTLRVNRFRQNSAPDDKLPNALRPIGITSPKNLAKNGWLSHQNGYHSLPIPCSNGLTAPVVKVNGFSNHHLLPNTGQPSHQFDVCCHSTTRRSSQANRTQLCDVVGVIDSEKGDNGEELSSPLVSLEAPEVKALQMTETLDVVTGSRSEQALCNGRESDLERRFLNHCQQQQTRELRKFTNLCKEKPASSSSSLSSASGCCVIVKKEKATCQWNDCGVDVDVDVLLDHITRMHIETQVQEKAEESKFVCLWNGCKFYNRSSVLQTWLERHILCHLGDKPYCCIVPQCRMRFASQFLLNRHINGHFSALQPRPPRKGDTQARQQKKKKLRNTRPCPVKTDDYFDSATMESIQNELVRSTQLTQGDLLHSGNTITFQSYSMAKRIDSNGHQETLLRWWPRNMLADEWVPESQVASFARKVLPLSSLPSEALQLLAMPPKPRHPPNQRRKNRKK